MTRIEQDEHGMFYSTGSPSFVELERLSPSEVSEVESLMESDPGEETEASLIPGGI